VAIFKDMATIGQEKVKINILVREKSQGIIKEHSWGCEKGGSEK